MQFKDTMGRHAVSWGGIEYKVVDGIVRIPTDDPKCVAELAPHGFEPYAPPPATEEMLEIERVTSDAWNRHRIKLDTSKPIEELKADLAELDRQTKNTNDAKPKK